MKENVRKDPAGQTQRLLSGSRFNLFHITWSICFPWRHQVASSCTAHWCCSSRSLCTWSPSPSRRSSWPSCWWWRWRFVPGTGSWWWPSSSAWAATWPHWPSSTSTLVGFVFFSWCYWSLYIVFYYILKTSKMHWWNLLWIVSCVLNETVQPAKDLSQINIRKLHKTVYLLFALHTNSRYTMQDFPKIKPRQKDKYTTTRFYWVISDDWQRMCGGAFILLPVFYYFLLVVVVGMFLGCI